MRIIKPFAPRYERLDDCATEVKIMTLSDGSVFIGVEYRKTSLDDIDAGNEETERTIKIEKEL